MKARKVKGLEPGAPLADNAERIVRARLDELHAFAPRALDPAQVETLHDMRIAAKRLRYVLELTGHCLGPYAGAAAKRTRELQDLLGEIHDCDETLPRLDALLAEMRAADAAQVRGRAADADDVDPALVGDTAAADEWRGVHAMATYLTARRALLFERFLQCWERLASQGFRARLEHAAGERP